MQIKDINGLEIINNEKINSQFLSTINNDLNKECKTYFGNFFLDSFNYFPITEENYTFKDHFSWGNTYKYENFYSQKFIDNFYVKKNNFSKFSNAFVLGSSVSDNYYRNIITFLPRLFFIDDKEINLVLHRNSSNRFRELIKQILKQLNVKVKKFIYLDDDFYYFENSKMPQFFNNSFSIKILNKVLSKNISDKKNKLYLSRQNSNYRNLINEGDLIDNLKDLDFEILDANNISIKEQIAKFSEASVVVGPTSSSLANIIFCSPGTNVIEIIPRYQFEYENELKSRYSEICNEIGLNYFSIEADPIEKNKIPNNVTKYIAPKVLDESNYYKDLLVEKNKFKQLVNNY